MKLKLNFKTFNVVKDENLQTYGTASDSGAIQISSSKSEHEEIFRKISPSDEADNFLKINSINR